jgi:hypothetical protein
MNREGKPEDGPISLAFMDQLTVHELCELAGNTETETERLGHPGRATGMLIGLEQSAQN